MKLLVFLSRLALSVILIGAGAIKALYPAEFALSIDSYSMVGPAAGAIAAVLLPAIELTTGVGLLTHRFRAGSAAVSVVLSLAFAIASWTAIRRGLGTCGCFGHMLTLNTEFVRWADCAMIAMALLVLRSALREADGEFD